MVSLNKTVFFSHTQPAFFFAASPVLYIFTAAFDEIMRGEQREPRNTPVDPSLTELSLGSGRRGGGFGGFMIAGLAVGS